MKHSQQQKLVLQYYKLALWKIIQRITGRTVDAYFEVQKRLISVISTHFGNLPARLDLLPFGHQALAIMSISAQQPITVLDDDEFTVSNQSITAIDNFSGCGCFNCLAFLAANFNAIARRIVSLEITDDSSICRPKPAGWVLPGNRCRRFVSAVCWQAACWWVACYLAACWSLWLAESSAQSYLLLSACCRPDCSLPAGGGLVAELPVAVLLVVLVEELASLGGDKRNS